MGFGAAQAQGDPPVARVLVSIRSTAVPVHGSGMSFADQVTASYAAVARTRIVLDPVISELGLRTTSGELAPRVASSVAEDTMIIDISVAGGSRTEEARIANAIGRHLVQASNGLSPVGAASTVELRQIGVAVAVD